MKMPTIYIELFVCGHSARTFVYNCASDFQLEDFELTFHQTGKEYGIEERHFISNYMFNYCYIQFTNSKGNVSTKYYTLTDENIVNEFSLVLDLVKIQVANV